MLLALAHLWAATLAQHLAARRDDRRDDRGDGALSTAAIAVGLVLIAGIVLLILREKATETANNICTAADPTTCR